MRKNAFYQWTDPFAPTRVGLGRRFVIQEWQRGVLFKDGRLDTVLGPGPYRRFQWGFALRRVDVRPWVLPVPMQEIPTADGLTVKVSVVGRARAIDPAAFVTASQDANAALYRNAQSATREAVAAAMVEQLGASRQEPGDALTGAGRGLDALGVVLERLELKAVIFSSELKKAQAEVIVARAQGLAALE